MKPAGYAVRTWFRSGLLAVAAGLALGQTAAPKIAAVRFWSFGDVTRVAIETDVEARYHAERIDTPDRLFIDLEGVRRQAGTRGIQVIPVGDRLLKQIRIAVLQPGVTRIVLDLTGHHEYSVSQLTYPDRIIVELRTAGTGAAVPPEHSVTGSQSLAETPETAAGPGTSAAGAEGAVMPAAAMIEPPAERKSQAIPVEKGLSNPVGAPVRVREAGIQRSQPAVSPDSLKATSAGVQVVSRLDQPAPPLAGGPPVRRDPTPVAEPPAVAPKTEKLNTALEVAQAAKSDSNGDHSLIRALGLKLDRVVIDPGHGGHDTGTIGRGGFQEKDLVLDVAKRLGVLITRRLGSEVIYTRSDDTFIPLEERTALANEKKADLFLSIHANSSHESQISGSETFYLNFTTSEDALDVAARENATSQTSIHELQTLVQKITLNEKVQESRELASDIQKAMYGGIPRNRSLKNRGVKKAPFVVLIGAQMPSVLAEIAFLSNPKDENQLKRPEYRQKIAEALFKGVSQYASALSHFQVAKQQRSGLTDR
jgi:N-acetylmuramoyl-L-alanine amidase